jgi:hypothetical protein
MSRSHVQSPQVAERFPEPQTDDIPRPPAVAAVLQLQRTAGNHRTAALLGGPLRQAPRVAVQRAAPAVGPALGVVANLAQTASAAGEAYSASLGQLTYSSPTGQRLSADPQPVQHSFRNECLSLVGSGLAANAHFDVEWEGNDHGEIGAARVILNQDKSNFFQFSSANVRFDLLNNLIQEGGNERTWQMQFAYEGHYDLVGAGYYAFQGKFAINAFGKFVSLAHSVRDYSVQPLHAGVTIKPGADDPGLALRETLVGHAPPGDAGQGAPEGD